MILKNCFILLKLTLIPDEKYVHKWTTYFETTTVESPSDQHSVWLGQSKNSASSYL